MSEQHLEFKFNVNDMITGNEIRHKVLENLPGGKGKNLQVFVAKATEKSEIEIIGKDKFMPSK